MRSCIEFHLVFLKIGITSNIVNGRNDRNVDPGVVI